jgi:hypothetical protein
MNVVTSLVGLVIVSHLSPKGSGRFSVVVFWHAEVVIFVVIPLIDVETLASWVVTLVVKAVAIVRVVGEAVVTCGHEVSHGTGILFLGTRGSGG